MTVLELMATLGLDTREFDTKLSDAETDVDELGSKVEALTDPKLGGTGQTVLKPLSDDAKTVDDQLLELQTKADDTSAVIEGFAQATSDVVQKMIEGIIEYGKQSIEAAANTGSELANAYNESVDDLGLGLDVLKVKTGETLLPAVTWWNTLLDSLSGSTRFEKLELLGAELEKLAAINLEETRDKLSSIFGLFEEVVDVEAGDIGDYTKNLEGQAKYWQNYADTLSSLKEKGFDPEFLSQIADGTEESLGALQALNTADTESMQTMMAAYESTKAAQDAAAQSMSELTLATDENAQAIAEAMAPLLAYSQVTSEEEPASFVQYIVDDLTETYPAIESMVNSINAKLAELGYGGENPLNLPGLHGEEGDGEEDGIEVTVEAVMSEESEGNLQGAVDEMELEGEALILADPSSGSKIQAYLNSLKLTAEVKLTVDDSALNGYKSDGSGRAVGLDYVPYDEYPATLHEGEAVLTKLEAERWRAGEGRGNGRGGDTFNVPVTVYGKADADAIADAVVEVLQNMRWMV